MRTLLILALLVAGSVTVVADPLPTVAFTDTLIAFTILDQFDEPHTEAALAGRVAVLLWADRKGSDHLQRWHKVIERKLRDEIEAGQVEVRMLGHTEGAPGFIRGMIKGRFPEDPQEWALMDWDGVFNAHYAPTADHVCPLVFGPDGRLLYQGATTRLNQADLDAVLAAVESGLGS